VPLLPGTRASRRSTAAILGPITVTSFTGPEACTSRYPGSIGAAFHPMLSKPLKAGPSSGPDGDRASWDEGANPACRRRHPRSANWPSPVDALGERGRVQHRGGEEGVNFVGEFASSINIAFQTAHARSTRHFGRLNRSP
jgi:hypothetical protein